MKYHLICKPKTYEYDSRVDWQKLGVSFSCPEIAREKVDLLNRSATDTVYSYVGEKA